MLVLINSAGDMGTSLHNGFVYQTIVRCGLISYNFVSYIRRKLREGRRDGRKKRKADQP